MNWDGRERRAEVLDTARLNEDIAEIKCMVKDVFKILNGNGQEGLVTRVALNRSSIQRAWWWLAALSTAAVGAAIACIKEFLTKPQS
jgi:hypothetical protein